MVKKIKVVLMENVKWYGNRWTVIDVSPAYANNVLFKQWLAKRATEWVLDWLKAMEEKKKQDHEKQLKWVYDMLIDIEKNWIKFEKQATSLNHLYDKIDGKELTKYILMNYHLKIPAEAFKLDNKISEIGEFEVKFEFEWIKKKLKVFVNRKD